MKLTKQEQTDLIGRGYRKEDLPQIEEAMNRCTYVLMYKDSNGKDVEEYIIATEAKELLGEKEFLSGIARAAYHWTCSRQCIDESKFVYFDCRVLFK